MNDAGIKAGQRVLVACSGGADSLALAAAAVFEATRSAIEVGAIIIDHGIQKETAQVASTTQETLLKLGLNPVEIIRVKIAAGGSVEAAARNARYEALEAAATKLGACAVLLGHTMDDQAETVLLGLARGAGARSLSGMASIRDSAGTRFLRPLLGIRRITTQSFCEDSGLEAWHDPHNDSAKFSRVRVRKNVIPVIENELGPGMVEALARTAEQLREDADYLDALAEAKFAALVSIHSTWVEFSAVEIDALPTAIRNRVIKKALEVFSGTISRAHVVAVSELVINWHGQKPLTLSGVRVERKGETLTLKTTKTLKPGAC
jgi:tRNA(Ile)-lysidine synthase